MRILLQLISTVSLVATLLPSIFFLSGDWDLEQTKTAMLAATVIWFVATPFWMGRDPRPANEELVL